MTKLERQKLQRIMRLLMSDDGYDEGMKLLGQMAGLMRMVDTIAHELKPTPIHELPKTENRTFRFEKKA